MAVDEENIKHREYYFIDKTGKVSIDLPKMGFDDARSFHDGRAAVQNVKGYCGYLNTQGELVVSDQYKLAFDYFQESHYALVQDQEGVFKFIDQNGNVKVTIGKNWCNVIRNEDSRQYNSDYPDARVVVTDEGLYYDAYGKVINVKE
ncbi:MAG TPA: WG repeat-containing protein [Candidatus Sphingobacterium stercoripullorum]|uniref:WG repeat-containing protein n=1 Tax=Candidatus Sphingobacterium stercoripullorum TaxID=2838759 RepID=A0A9D1W8T7_9SPHI|nr:WG repeat-containing protein [Candidatus Sphingobacterium stercoripullorum]